MDSVLSNTHAHILNYHISYSVLSAHVLTAERDANHFLSRSDVTCYMLLIIDSPTLAFHIN